jgi:phospholipase C
MPVLDNIQTIVLLMFENRSFDHMLGHLSLDDPDSEADGLKKPLSKYFNTYKGDKYKVFNLPGDTILPFDIPHEFDAVDTQLAKSKVTGKFTMNGFVEAYAKATNVNPNPQTEPMGFFNSSQVPVTSFLAKTFCTCDRWFCSIPTSTQPNRTIAFSGDTEIFETKSRLISLGDNIFDWLDTAGVKWRVYHDGLSFFAMYPSLWGRVLSDNFRDYENLYSDMQSEDDSTFPQIILVEPSYESAPHIGSDIPNDNHAPLPVGWGEEFLRRTYEAVIANSNRWGSTLFIVYYDEHGGFYDHVAPPLIPYKTTGIPNMQFYSLGPRIPGIIISPYVQQGSVCHSIFDHTSILQLLAEKYTPGVPYCDSVDLRGKSNPGIASITEALTNDTVWYPPTPPTDKIEVSSALGDRISVAPTEPIAQGFELAAMEMIKNNDKDSVNKKYPELFQWKDAVDKNR